MLKKLISYEVKSVARNFVPIYCLILAVSTILGLYLHSVPVMMTTGSTGDGLFFSLLIAILVSLYVALYVITIMMIIKRFNVNLLGDEGYLMMTLPVSVDSILHSKWISALLWFILSAIISGISGFIVLFLSGFSDFMASFREIMNIMSEIPVGTVLLALSNFFFGFLYFLFLVYACISVAHLPRFTKHKTIWAIVFYIFVSNVVGIIEMKIANTLGENVLDSIAFFNHLLEIQLLFQVIGLAVCFFITQHILNKKLNLN